MACPLLNIKMDLLYGSRNREEVKSMIDSHIPASKTTIMVVDDNPDIVTIVKTLLEGKGFKVQPAYSGYEVFIKLAKKNPTLIILDIMMPHMDGLEVLVRLRRNLATRSVPVILLTGKVNDEDVCKGYDIGADYYVKKPFDTFNLLTGITLLLGGRDLHKSRV